MSFVGKMFFGEYHEVDVSFKGNIMQVQADLQQSIFEESKGELRFKTDKYGGVDIYKPGSGYQAIPRFKGVIEELDGKVSMRGTFITSRFIIGFFIIWFLFFLIPVGRDVAMSDIDGDTFGMTLFILAGVLLAAFWSISLAKPVAKVIHSCIMGCSSAKD